MMKITWIGHSAVQLQGSRTIYIDPFLTGNPIASVSVNEVEQADVVFVTHDHGDHLGDSFAICKKTKAVFVSTYEIAEAAAREGLITEKMNVGGTIIVKGIEISMVPAFHTGGLGGTAVGVVIAMDDCTVYHAGDTGLSMEMQLIGEMYQPDVGLLPIDGRFNMTPRLAAKAVELLKIPKIIPIHYNTFPMITSSAQEFVRLAGDKCQVIILNPGETLEI
jgi:L-ascorbate metabolism protein UlaG (beta-lactamase superfamily)